VCAPSGPECAEGGGANPGWDEFGGWPGHGGIAKQASKTKYNDEKNIDQQNFSKDNIPVCFSELYHIYYHRKRTLCSLCCCVVTVFGHCCEGCLALSHPSMQDSALVTDPDVSVLRKNSEAHLVHQRLSVVEQTKYITKFREWLI